MAHLQKILAKAGNFEPDVLVQEGGYLSGHPGGDLALAGFQAAR